MAWAVPFVETTGILPFTPATPSLKMKWLYKYTLLGNHWYYLLYVQLSNNQQKFKFIYISNYIFKKWVLKKTCSWHTNIVEKIANLKFINEVCSSILSICRWSILIFCPKNRGYNCQYHSFNNKGRYSLRIKFFSFFIFYRRFPQANYS